MPRMTRCRSPSLSENCRRLGCLQRGPKPSQARRIRTSSRKGRWESNVSAPTNTRSGVCSLFTSERKGLITCDHNWSRSPISISSTPASFLAFSTNPGCRSSSNSSVSSTRARETSISIDRGGERGVERRSRRLALRARRGVADITRTVFALRHDPYPQITGSNRSISTRSADRPR